MNFYKLKQYTTNNTLFEGRFTTFIQCLEQAVKDNVNLENIDLKNQNLTNANLDDAIMPGADFTGTNLTGANFSESHLPGANFTQASLYNACLAHSNLIKCKFLSADFGATDITGALITHATFSTLSCFTLNFTNTHGMNGCHFINTDGSTSKMSNPPIIIHGITNAPIIIMDNDIRNGHTIINHRHLTTTHPFSPVSLKNDS